MPKVQGVITKDGDFVNNSILSEYAVEKDSKQLPSDRFQDSYKDGPIRLKKPPYELETLAQLTEENTWHYRACKVKTMDTVGHGYELQDITGEEEKPSQEQKEVWEEFEQRVKAKTGQTLLEVLYEFWWNFEDVGNCYLEIIRDVEDGEKLDHVAYMPAQTIRRGADRDIEMQDTGETVNGMQIYAQKRGAAKRYFKAYGAEFDIHYDTGQVYSEGSLPAAQRGNELLHLKNHSSKSDFYGLPDCMPAMRAILGDMQAQEYNIDFFENHGVPAYAVTVTGAALDSDTEDLIHQYFEEEVKKSRHGTLVLTVDSETGQMTDNGDIEIKFHELAVQQQEGSFEVYREDNRGEILSAHGVPEYRAAIAKTGSLGGDVARDMDDIYKSSVIDFRQMIVTERLNGILLSPLGITDYKLAFQKIDVSDEEHEDNRLEQFFTLGSLTPNELREYLDREPSDQEGMDTFYINGQPVEQLMQEEEEEDAAMMSAEKNVKKEVEEVVREEIRDLKNQMLDIAKKNVNKSAGHHGHGGLQGQVGGSAPEGMVAGSVSEAENIAEENFAEEVDFSGLGVDACNQINHALMANDDIDFEEEPLTAVKTENLGTANARVTGEGEIVINPNVMGDAEDFNENCKALNSHKRFEDTTQEDISNAESELGDIQEDILEEVPEEAQQRAQELLEEGHGAGKFERMGIDREINNLMGHAEEEPFDERLIKERSKYGEINNMRDNLEEGNFARRQMYETVNDVVTHELGHELARRALKGKGHLEAYEAGITAEDLADSVPDWEDEYNMSDWDNEEHMEYKMGISEYANSDVHEYIAESYLADKRGEDINRDMEDFIRGELVND